ncbi:MAG: Flp pilus assembly protein CpaB, partial [Alphaproteobacteria bacterium]
MFNRKIFIIVAILVMAGMFGMMAKSFLATPNDQTAVAAPSIEEPAALAPQILVAVDDLPAGTFIKSVSVRWQDWPEDAIMAAHVRQGEQTVEDFTGSVVRHGIVAGEPIVGSKLVRPGEHGFLAAVLTPGKRAASVSVNAVSGNAGLIFPGDRIDVILTQQLDMSESAPGRHTVGETILRNARVIAVDQRVQDIAQGGETQAAPVAKTVTLEVEPRGAETLAVA